MKPVFALISVAVVAVASPAHAALYSYLPLNTINAGTTPNAAPGGTQGTIFGTGITVENDATRGLVLESDGINVPANLANNARIEFGSTIPLTPTNEHTWSFWSNPNEGATSDVIFGNRGPGSTNWIKFTPTKFEYVNSGVGTNLDYPDIITGVGWQHHAVVKNGLNLTYYRNGAPSLTGTIASALPSVVLPLNIFGDAFFAESWAGRLDDVALFNNALSAGDIAGLANGTFTPITVPEPSRAILMTVPLVLGLCLRRRR